MEQEKLAYKKETHFLSSILLSEVFFLRNREHSHYIIIQNIRKYIGTAQESFGSVCIMCVCVCVCVCVYIYRPAERKHVTSVLGSP
jgi:hypothetical protein